MLFQCYTQNVVCRRAVQRQAMCEQPAPQRRPARPLSLAPSCRARGEPTLPCSRHSRAAHTAGGRDATAIIDNYIFSSIHYSVHGKFSLVTTKIKFHLLCT